MTIAVSSASGQLGSTIVKALLKEVTHQKVIAIARTPERAEHLGVEVRAGNYNDREQFNAALKGVDVVLLVSGMDEPKKRIEQHRNVLEAAKQNGVRKIVYTSIVGSEAGTAFSPVVQSNRQTEKDIQQSGLEYIIGRNGIYIEPDLEYIDNYIKEGGIINSANQGKCTYTSREELGYAYAKLILNDDLNGSVLNLVGQGITQSELAHHINKVYNTNLQYFPISVEAYQKARQEALGNHLGTIISGIYHSISIGAMEVPSDFEKVTGRPHKLPIEMIQLFKAKQG